MLFFRNKIKLYLYKKRIILKKNTMFFKSVLVTVFTLFYVFAYGQKCNLETKGFYVADYKEDVKIYLHFYAKDSLLTTSSNMSIEEAKLTLSPNNKHNALKGKYNKKNCNVFIEAGNGREKVKMEGVISGNTLKLTVTNLKDKSFEDFIFKLQN